MKHVDRNFIFAWTFLLNWISEYVYLLPCIFYSIGFVERERERVRGQYSESEKLNEDPPNIDVLYHTT